MCAHPGPSATNRTLWVTVGHTGQGQVGHDWTHGTAQTRTDPGILTGRLGWGGETPYKFVIKLARTVIRTGPPGHPA